MLPCTSCSSAAVLAPDGSEFPSKFSARHCLSEVTVALAPTLLIFVRHSLLIGGSGECAMHKTRLAAIRDKSCRQAPACCFLRDADRQLLRRRALPATDRRIRSVRLLKLCNEARKKLRQCRHFAKPIAGRRNLRVFVRLTRFCPRRLRGQELGSPAFLAVFSTRAFLCRSRRGLPELHAAFDRSPVREELSQDGDMARLRAVDYSLSRFLASFSAPAHALELSLARNHGCRECCQSEQVVLPVDRVPDYRDRSD